MTEDLGAHLHYDEQLAIETYVLRNFPHLLSDDERATLDGGLARWWDDNLERMKEWGAHARVVPVAPPWEPAPFAAAHVADARAIVARLRAVHGSAVEPLRCAACHRVVRGPEAGVCPWCLAPVRAAAGA